MYENTSFAGEDYEKFDDEPDYSDVPDNCKYSYDAENHLYEMLCAERNAAKERLSKFNSMGERQKEQLLLDEFVRRAREMYKKKFPYLNVPSDTDWLEAFRVEDSKATWRKTFLDKEKYG
jgi:hypothetical protein